MNVAKNDPVHKPEGKWYYSASNQTYIFLHCCHNFLFWSHHFFQWTINKPRKQL